MNCVESKTRAIWLPCGHFANYIHSRCPTMNNGIMGFCYLNMGAFISILVVLYSDWYLSRFHNILLHERRLHTFLLLQHLECWPRHWQLQLANRVQLDTARDQTTTLKSDGKSAIVYSNIEYSQIFCIAKQNCFQHTPDSSRVHENYQGPDFIKIFT